MHPKQNGRVERLHETVEYILFNYHNLFDDIILIGEQCMKFNEKYNYQRYNQSFGYKKLVGAAASTKRSGVSYLRCQHTQLIALIQSGIIIRHILIHFHEHKRRFVEGNYV